MKFDHVNGHEEDYLMPENLGGGVALFDMDDDGDLDVYFVQSGNLTQPVAENPPNQLYRNNGDGTFENITEGSGAGDRQYGTGVAAGDYDNDGDTDLYVTNYGHNVMLRNEGGGRFTDVTAETGTGDEKLGAGASFVDYDGDGDLDLYIANYIYWMPEIERGCLNAFGDHDYCMPTAYEAPAHDTLYRNNGDGTFTDVSKVAGIHESLGNGLGVICGDFNLDGHVDIYVANDGMKNILWINQGNGTFLDRALLAGCAVDQDGREKAGMGVTALDIDYDGDLDLLVVNLDNEADSFYRNEGQYFVEESSLIGLAVMSSSFTRFGVGFADFDNDGHIDIYEVNGKVSRQEGAFLPGGNPYAEPNMLVRGLPSGKFQEIMPRGGTADQLIDVSRSAAFGDFDNDGGMDVLVTNLNGPAYVLRNIVSQRGLWIGFRIREYSGRDALGATLTFSAGQRHITRDVISGYSYLAANDPRIHVGLGETSSVSEIIVRWADGVRESFPGIREAGFYHSLQRGEGEVIN